MVVDRAFKNDVCTMIGLSKWDKIRTIALPEIAQDALLSLFHNKDDIPVTYRNLATIMTKIEKAASKLDGLEMPEYWPKLTPHILCHSINTMLRLEGLPDVLVAEYMSWEHQDGNKIQEIYTHVYARDLLMQLTGILAMVNERS